MAALAAARANPDLSAFRARLIAAGKPHRVALTAVLRKLVILADALIRDHRTWTPQRPRLEDRWLRVVAEPHPSLAGVGADGAGHVAGLPYGPARVVYRFKRWNVTKP